MTYKDMCQAIVDENLEPYNIIFTYDTYEQFIINSKFKPILFKTQIRVFSCADAALEFLKGNHLTDGEIVAIQNGNFFDAYIIESFEGGDQYIVPVVEDNQINDMVIVSKIHSKASEPIKISELKYGIYKLSGNFINTEDKLVSSVLDNFIFVEQLDINLKIIRRIANKNIITSIYDGENKLKETKILIDKYLKNRGVSLQEFPGKLPADITFLLFLEDALKDYISVTLSSLIKQIEEKGDFGYLNDNELLALF